ncbi:ABC transporter substrate-binding protein [Roseomonas sp. CCTCC AB2023176]|uniref:ABC transporter substrate-binding protein n=1 Tax=Roseomonas sp. CCTCC AB2023176 TaxID=3342640 RepID=UPI0035DF1654
MVARRDVFRGAAAALATGFSLNGAAPAQAQSANRTLRFIPHADLSAIDPFATTGYVVRNHGYMVYDTLYSLDAEFRPRPQMAEGHEITDDGRTYTIRLREGLKFHDGEPVRAADCVASLRRWAARDGFGATLMAATDELSAVDDRTLRFRLKQPFPLLLEAIGKPSSPVPFIMPERVAQTPPTTQIRETVGSGPFRFLRDEWVPGSRAAYARHDGYVPRNESLDGAAGGKVVNFDRVEWITIPDPGTATAAIQRGEVDWYEQPQGDLLPVLRRNRDVQVTTYDPIGAVVLLRFNHLHPPFDDVRVRRAVLTAVNQGEYMQAMVGDPSIWRECKAFFPCGTPMSSGTGSDVMTANLERARAMLRESGYDGRKVTVISPTDLAYLHALGLVTEDLLKRIGFNVDFVATDWGSVLTRRANLGPPEQGGWNVFHTTAVGVEFMSPASHLALRGNGRAAWPGWPTNERMEALRTEWMAATDLNAQKAIAARMEAEAFSAVPYAPLGQYTIPTALRRNLTGLHQAGAPFVWGLRKG